MISVESFFIGSSDETVYTLNKSFDTKKKFSKNSEVSAKLNFATKVEWFDFEECVDKYKASQKIDSNALLYASLLRNVKGNVTIQQKEEQNPFSYYVHQAERKIVEGLFLHLSDDRECYLNRKSSISLVIDHLSYKFPCFFSPDGDRGGYDYTTDCYYKITPDILKALANSYSINLLYINPDKGEKNVELDISKFQEYAKAFYDYYYLASYGSPEEKETVRREFRAKLEDERKREEEKKAEADKKFFEEEAPFKTVLEKSDLKTTMKIMVKRHWIKVLIAIILFFILLLSSGE